MPNLWWPEAWPYAASSGALPGLMPVGLNPFKAGDAARYQRKLDMYALEWMPVAHENNLPMPLLDEPIGCGFYGCVFKTQQPEIAMKYTESYDEATLMNWQIDARIPGLVPTFFVLQIRRNSFLIWRMLLDQCCGLARETLMDEGLLDKDEGRWDNLLTNQSMRMTPRDAIKNGRKIAAVKGLRDIGLGIIKAAKAGHVIFDLHMNNLGRWMDYDQLIIFDAGLTFDTTRSYAQLPVSYEEEADNPDGDWDWETNPPKPTPPERAFGDAAGWPDLDRPQNAAFRDWVLLQLMHHRVRGTQTPDKGFLYSFPVLTDFMSEAELKRSKLKAARKGFFYLGENRTGLQENLRSYLVEQLRLVKDWYLNNQPLDLIGFTLEEAMAASEQWHETCHLGGPKKYEQQNVVYRWPDGWTVQDVQSSNDLEAEGNLMGHCVGGAHYKEMVESGAGKIFSLRDKGGKPHATIETDLHPEGMYVNQIQGRENAPPVPKHVARLREWFSATPKIIGQWFGAGEGPLGFDNFAWGILDWLNGKKAKYQRLTEPDKYGLLEIPTASVLDGALVEGILNVYFCNRRVLYTERIYMPYDEYLPTRIGAGLWDAITERLGSEKLPQFENMVECNEFYRPLVKRLVREFMVSMYTDAGFDHTFDEDGIPIPVPA